MYNIPKSFLSPLLAQAKLRFSGNSSGGSTPLCSIIATNYCENTMTRNSNISETPTFDAFCQLKEEEQYIDSGKTISEAIEEEYSCRKTCLLKVIGNPWIGSVI